MLVTSLCMLHGKDNLEAREFVSAHEDLSIEPFEDLSKGPEPLATLSPSLLKKFCPVHEGLGIIIDRKITMRTAVQWGLLYDPAEGRLIFPVYNGKGNLVGFRGRSQERKAKMKTREYSELSPKRQSLKGYGIWYGMHLKPEPKQKVILVEGEMDAVKLSQALANRPGVWAAMGSSLSDEQIKTIQAIKNPVLLFFDNDEAGIDARRKMLAKLRNVKAGVFIVDNYVNCNDPDEIADKGLLAQSLKSIIQVG